VRIRAMKAARYVLSKLKVHGAVEIYLDDFNMDRGEGHRVCAALKVHGYQVIEDLYRKQIVARSTVGGTVERLTIPVQFRKAFFGV
jgi:hypothetical protein